MAEIRFSLRVDDETWSDFLRTIPRPEYPSVNYALNQMIADRIANHDTHSENTANDK